MSQSEVKKILQEYIKNLKQSFLPLWRVYLFGSYANGKQHNLSDIDVAVVIDGQRASQKRQALLWTNKPESGLLIEPHLFFKKDFLSPDNILANEVKKTGWRAY